MNPDRDYAIIRARRDVQEAEEALAKFPGSNGALRVQRAKREWASMKALHLIKDCEQRKA